MSSSDKFLTYYHRELSYLRNAGKVFAAEHPKIARRLQVGETESPDPHTERLLESFAYLTARLSEEIDDRLPHISAALLNVLYPHLVAPIPSMAISQFVVDPSKGKLTTGFEIAKQTQVFTYAEEGVSCRFRTAYPVTLWPITVLEADFIHGDAYTIANGHKESKWYLRLKLRCDSLTFADLDINSLRFNIAGDNGITYTLYDALMGQSNPQVLISCDGKVAKVLPNESLKPVGFSADERLLPSPEHSHPAYQLLHEYFHYRDKFLFFDLLNLDMKAGDETVDLLISISDQHIVGKIEISPSNFRLGCTPIINLFPKITDPLRLDHRQFEYRLVPDQRRERTTEIYSILKVASTMDNGVTAEEFPPYYSFDHTIQAKDPHVFWVWRRASSQRREVPGTDVYLSFVDLDFNPKLPPLHTVYAQTLCTNRFLSEQIPAGGELQIEDRLPISRIVLLTKPSTQVYSPADGETMWRLISQLSVNHLSVSSGESSLNALKETLRLYSRTNHNYENKEIDALIGLKSHPTTRRMGGQSWRGFIHGLHIDLEVNERVYTGVSVFLLSSVLRHFFALQVSVNSFVELQLNSIQRQGEWIRWQPLRGDQIIL